MFPSFRTVALASASVIALSAAAAAQEAAETVTLDTITLTATTDASVQAEGFVSDYAQAATKSDTPVSETQQSVSVVTTEQIEQQGADSLGEALSYSTGVLGQPFGADPRFNSPTIRGFTSENAQYVNGLRQGRLFGAQAYEIYGMQQIEVVRGPSSSLYGSGSPAGVINQVQKRAQAGDFAEAGAGFDDNGSGQLFFDVNRSPDEVLSWRLTGIARDDQTQIDELTNERGYLGAAMRLNTDGATTIDLLASYTKDSPISPVGVPYGLTSLGDSIFRGDDEDLRDIYTGEPGFDDSDRRMWNVGVEISHELDNGWRLSQGFRYEKFDWDYTGTSVAFGQVVNPDGTFNRTTIDQSEDSETISLDTRLSGELATGQATHRLLVGLDVQKYDATDFTIFGTAPPFDLRNPTYDPDAVTLDGFRGGRDVTFKQIGLYVQDEVEWGNWRGTFGLRHDWAEQDGVAYGADSSFDDSQTTGRLGLSYAMDNGLMPYVSYSTSFEPLPGSDIAGNALEPTEGKQWEAGVKYSPSAFEGLITAAVYDLRQTNLTRPVSEVIDGETRSGLRQIGEVKSRGVELSALASLGDAWDVEANYAYNDTEQLEGVNEGDALPNAPRHLANLWVTRDFGNGIRAGGGIRHIGDRFGDEANELELDSVTLVDLGATWERERIEASMNLSNLTDEAYVASCSSFGCFYGEGRTFSAKVAYKW